MWPHGRQPTRLPHPWDSPGKNTGVGCHFFLQCRKVKSESEVAQSCPTLSDPMDCSLPGPPSMGFSRQEYWSGVPLPSPPYLLYFPIKKLSCVWHDMLGLFTFTMGIHHAVCFKSHCSEILGGRYLLPTMHSTHIFKIFLVKHCSRYFRYTHTKIDKNP